MLIRLPPMLPSSVFSPGRLATIPLMCIGFPGKKSAWSLVAASNAA